MKAPGKKKNPAEVGERLDERPGPYLVTSIFSLECIWLRCWDD